MKALRSEGVDTIFGYPGGAVIDIYDELAKTDIRHILVRHEQGAVHAADGYARASGRVGVCLVTSGPGATNTVTGIASAYIAKEYVLSGLVDTSKKDSLEFEGITSLKKSPSNSRRVPSSPVMRA